MIFQLTLEEAGIELNPFYYTHTDFGILCACF